MSKIVSPIATPMIDGVQVRFFRAPMPEPHLPWHALSDLHRAMALPWDLRRQLMERSRSFPHADREFATLTTLDGPVFAGSHPMAMGVISAATEVHGIKPEFHMAYTVAITAAMKSLTAGMSEIENFQFLMTAARNTLGVNIQSSP